MRTAASLAPKRPAQLEARASIMIRIDVRPELAERYRAAGFWQDATLADWLAAREREHEARDALRQGDRRVTWAELARLVRVFAGSLHRLGVAKGDVVAVQLPNVVEFAVAYLAIASRGAVMQTLHMPYRAAELSTLLAHSGAVCAIVPALAKDYAAARVVSDLQPGLPALRQVIAVGPGDVPANVARFDRLIAAADDGAADEVPIAPSVAPSASLSGADAFLLLYTSGTTSAPKGVPHAYRNFLSNSRGSAAELSVGPADVLLSAAPFTHLYGLFTFNMALATGATTVLLPAFSPPDLARLMDEARPTVAFTAPAHIAACLGQKLFDGRDLSSLRYVQISGSMVPAALARAFEALLPTGKVMQLWGMTELQAGAFTRLADAEAVRVETTGRPSPGTELRVVRDDGALAAPGEVGELQVRGPSLFAGYLNDDAATRAAFTDEGFFRTGDLARLDDAGNTVLCGRSKDIINRGGVKFNPVDVENRIAQHRAVDACAIVPMPDPVLGERACCFAALRPGQSLDLADLQRWLEEAGIGKLKWPERLEILAALPMTPTRKVMKGELAKRFAA
jgi:cyclohexanecarboxylate-CoA ligase/acyl-CoA synthetase